MGGWGGDPPWMYWRYQSDVYIDGKAGERWMIQATQIPDLIEGPIELLYDGSPGAVTQQGPMLMRFVADGQAHLHFTFPGGGRTIWAHRVTGNVTVIDGG